MCSEKGLWFASVKPAYIYGYQIDLQEEKYYPNKDIQTMVDISPNTIAIIPRVGGIIGVIDRNLKREILQIHVLSEFSQWP